MAASHSCRATSDSDGCEFDLFRANLYGLLGRLLAAPPDHALLASVAALRCGDGTALGVALDALADAAATVAPADLDAEFHALFIGLGQGELLPYASYYLTGFLNEKPLARLRGDMARLGIAPSADRCEPEDHLASLCEMMAGLINGSFGKPTPTAEQRDFFETHIDAWIDRFLDDLGAAPAARFYRAVAALAKTFFAIEREGFSLASGR